VVPDEHASSAKMVREDLPVSAALWALPISWVVHDAEEVLTVEAWSHGWTATVAATDESGLRARLVGTLAGTRRRFAVAASLVGVVAVGATVAGVRDPDGVGMVVFATVLGGYFLHAFVHVGQSVLLCGYAPGVVTAVAVVVPTSVALYRRLFAADLLAVETAVSTAVGGLVVFTPLVLAANELARRLVPTAR
jgi:hypothetical protein